MAIPVNLEQLEAKILDVIRTNAAACGIKATFTPLQTVPGSTQRWETKYDMTWRLRRVRHTAWVLKMSGLVGCWTLGMLTLFGVPWHVSLLPLTSSFMVFASGCLLSATAHLFFSPPSLEALHATVAAELKPMGVQPLVRGGWTTFRVTIRDERRQ
jgi:hypothetical protein